MLMMVGIMIWPRRRRVREDQSNDGNGKSNYRDTGTDHIFNINLLFDSRREIIRDDQLAGGHGTAVFGSLDLDLRQASPKDNAYLEITAVFGSVSIMIPSNWKVVKHGGPVFGKVNDNRINVPGDGFMKTVTIEMNAIFGHVDLVN
jgi:hypothetical protein